MLYLGVVCQSFIKGPFTALAKYVAETTRTIFNLIGNNNDLYYAR